MSSNAPLYFFSAGEPSGDQHAARLITELRRRNPNARFVGCGGPAMQAAGCEIIVPLTKVAVMGILPVLWNLRSILNCLRMVQNYLRSEKPDAVILIDFPGFNWRVARQAKSAGIPVIYFMPPQIWAWAQWRVKKMKRLVNHVLCPLEFEAKWFRSKGINVDLIGHPFLEGIRKRQADNIFLADLNEKAAGRKILALLPGSRDQEIRNNIRDQLETLEKVIAQVPNVFPIIAAYKESQAGQIRELLQNKSLQAEVYVGRTQDLMKVADCSLAVSGSVSLELLANACPTVIYYRISRIIAFASRFFLKVKYITLTNLIAADQIEGESPFYPDKIKCHQAELSPHDRDLMVFPEFLTTRNRSSEVADLLIDWLTGANKLTSKRTALEDLLRKVDRIGDPIANAADSIDHFLQNFDSTKR